MDQTRVSRNKVDIRGIRRQGGQSAFSQIPTCSNLRDVFIGAYSRLWMLDAADTTRYPISLEHHKVERNIVSRSGYAIIFNIRSVSK